MGETPCLVREYTDGCGVAFGVEGLGACAWSSDEGDDGIY